MLCTAGGITLKEGGQVQKLVDFLVSGRSGVPQKHLCFVLALAEALTIVNVHQPTPPPPTSPTLYRLLLWLWMLRGGDRGDC